MTQQTPVATFDEVWDSIDWDKWRMEPIRELVKMIHSKTTPPQRTWVGLTEEDFSAINQSCLTKLQAAISAESILKEKNT